MGNKGTIPEMGIPFGIFPCVHGEVGQIPIPHFRRPDKVLLKGLIPYCNICYSDTYTSYMNNYYL